MSQWKPLGLIASGRMTSSLLLRRPALSRHLGPVVAPDRRLAARYSNSLRAGAAAPVEELHGAGLVLVHADSAGLARLLPMLAGAGPWRGSHFALLNPDLDATALAPLRASGAKVCSVATAPSRGRDLAVVEGDRRAILLAKQWLHEGHMRCLELAPGRKALFQLGLLSARGLLAPLLDAALMSLRASGLSASEARRLLYETADASVRAFAARGRKALEDPLGETRMAALEKGLAEAARYRQPLAEFLADVLEAVGRFQAPVAAAETGEDSGVPGRAASITQV
jgi:hypothetical protein